MSAGLPFGFLSIGQGGSGSQVIVYVSGSDSASVVSMVNSFSPFTVDTKDVFTYSASVKNKYTQNVN